MRKTNARFLYVIIFLTAILSCKKLYNPTIAAAATSYLVVEGTINSGNDSTIIKLSNTVTIAGNTNKPVSKAIVTIESDHNTTYQLKEIVAGSYAIGPVTLDNTFKYRLRIKTADSKEYLSDAEAVENTPPIDSIGFTVQSKGIDIYLNTHDPKNSTRYYRWDYNETWQFHAKYASNYKAVNSSIVFRTDQVYYCFASDASNNIVLGSSAKLQQDVIDQAPITQIASNSEKIELRYSILVRQYALTKEAFKFWSNLKTNTEQLGGIFDAQPSQISGNIHSITNPAEPVIGYISVSNIQSKRVFIANSQLPQTQAFVPLYPYDCELDTTLFLNPITKHNDVSDFLLGQPPSAIPTNSIAVNGIVVGYLRTSSSCGDCTVRGTNKQPAFWK